jgi:putative transposase
MSRRSRAKPPSPFRYFNSSPEVIRLVVMMYVRFPLSLRNVEDLLFERGIDICHETALSDLCGSDRARLLASLDGS